MSRRVLPSHLFVVFGATGDLMARKLLPALHQLAARGQMGERWRLLGIARSRDYDDRTYRTWAGAALDAAGLAGQGHGEDWCARHLHYQTLGAGGAADYAALAARIGAIEAEAGLAGNRTFYLALPPAAVAATIGALGEHGLNQGPGWTRVVIEKPFGHDADSARALNDQLHACFDERQIYRIDHYLGKETVQNLLVLRFANTVFESLWNRDRVESVQITVAERLGIEGRATYYDQAGAVRDVVQNHLSQLLALIAMEVPPAFEAEAIRSEKVKVLRSIAPVRAEDVVLGQYAAGTMDGRAMPGYLQETGVAPGSTTETFAALRLEIDNWRWKGVPFYLRTGKRLPRRLTQIVVQFRRPPVSLFGPVEDGELEVHRNILAITLQPDEGFDLRFEVKRPGETFALATHGLDFRYEDVYGALGDAYETLLKDILVGDQTLFVRADEVETAWRLYAPLADASKVPLFPYFSGTWGPLEAERLVARDAGRWIVLDRPTQPSVDAVVTRDRPAEARAKAGAPRSKATAPGRGKGSRPAGKAGA